jgi:hypothetical protein
MVAPAMHFPAGQQHHLRKMFLARTRWRSTLKQKNAAGQRDYSACLKLSLFIGVLENVLQIRDTGRKVDKPCRPLSEG